MSFVTLSYPSTAGMNFQPIFFFCKIVKSIVWNKVSAHRDLHGSHSYYYLLKKSPDTQAVKSNVVYRESI